MGIGNTLYSIVNGIGKEKIQSDITSDIRLSRHYIKMIMAQCEKRTGAKDEETVGSLSEALLHFMLTVSTLPSARKVRINNIELDIVIPNLYTLRNSPDKAIVIQISKSTNRILQQRLNSIMAIQPNDKNLWVVSRKPLSMERVNYIVEPDENAILLLEKRNFHDIIVDIDNFLEQTGDRSLRLFQ
jgi:hypothetical protein